MQPHTLSLSDAQWRLILELVQIELDDLPHEIRHTDSHDVRDALHARMRELSGLADLLRDELTAPK